MIDHQCIYLTKLERRKRKKTEKKKPYRGHSEGFQIFGHPQQLEELP
jgi:hypothetical protein